MTFDKGTKTITGEFMLPVVDDDIKDSDPWGRNYFAPPPFHNHLIAKSFPLIDVRPLLSQPGYTPDGLLQSHGFGVVRHHSAVLEGLDLDGELSEQVLVDKYLPEVRELVMKVTGAKIVFVTASGVRRGKRTPEKFTVPDEMKRLAPPSSGGQDEKGISSNPSSSVVPSQNGHQEAAEKKNGQGSTSTSTQSNKYVVGPSRFAQSKPIRMPHMDFTPLGARQAIRFHAVDIHRAAVESGVIAAEDSICEEHSVTAPTKEAEPAITQLYNPKGGELSPRYAAYSIWRPIKKVQRDPIALSPRETDPTDVPAGMVYWPYDNKIPGTAELSGDYLKEYATIGVEQEEEETTTSDDPMKWYYVSHQEPDEVVFIKLFDSASLGQDAQHAPAPWHASPEIGDAEGEEPRESMDIRVIVFW